MFRPIVTTVISLTFLSQVAFAQAVPAEPGVALTPELELIEEMISIQGSPLSPIQFRQEIGKAVQAYDRASAPEGRKERFVDALSKAGLLDATQAAAFMADIERSVRSGQGTNTSAISAIAVNYLRNPTGSSFSANDVPCAMILGGWAVAIVSGLVLLKFQSDQGGPGQELAGNIAFGGFYVSLAGMVIYLVASFANGPVC